MINKKNIKYSDRDKSRKKSTFHHGKSPRKKYSNEIKVVSTNVTKDKKSKESKEIKEKKDKKIPFLSSKKTNNIKINKSKKYDKPKKTEQLNKNIIDKKSSIKNEIMQYKLKAMEKQTCFKCSRVIEDMESSIKDTNVNKFYHFNCILNEIKKDNVINSKQRVVYLGSGAFGIIENLSSDSNSYKFVIKKKIQYIDNSVK